MSKASDSGLLLALAYATLSLAYSVMFLRCLGVE